MSSWIQATMQQNTIVTDNSLLNLMMLLFFISLPSCFYFYILIILVKTRKQTFSIHREVITISRDFYALKNLYTYILYWLHPFIWIILMTQILWRSLFREVSNLSQFRNYSYMAEVGNYFGESLFQKVLVLFNRCGQSLIFLKQDWKNFQHHRLSNEWRIW